VTQPLARLSGVVKRFGSVTALDGAGLTVLPGEVHGVLGENGAGKTTLLHVLGGMHRPDAGLVEVEGQVRRFASPREAWRAGVGLVHQHFTLVPTLTVLENLALGRRSASGGFRLPYATLRREVGALVDRTGLGVPLEARVESLGVGTRQRVEILKTLLRRPRILVLDEPTAVLAPAEVGALFQLLRELAAEGRAVVLVAHKLDEILGVADRLTVLRRGRTVLQRPREEVDASALVGAMVGDGRVDPVALGRVGASRAGPADSAPGATDPGAEVDAGASGGRAPGAHREGAGGRDGVEGASPADGAASAPARPGGVLRPGGPMVAVLKGVRHAGERGEEALADVSLGVRRGEIVGVAGVEGNGQRELSLVLSGRAVADRGRVELPAEVAFIPQDRTREGVVADFDLRENVALTLHRRPGYRSGPLLRWSAVKERTARLMERFDVRAPGPYARASALSGGNQQRLVVARELEVASELVVAENPTRGLDVNAAAFVHQELRRLSGAEGGPGVVLISTDLDEVLALSDRVLVMVRGRLLPVPEGERTRAGVGRLMLSGEEA
jgi:simple sugar transport system ATP-binding protein